MDLFNLSGKTALITGASSGLGVGFAKTLSNAGARVILAARRKDRLDALAQEIGNAVSVYLDISSEDSVRTAFAKLEKDGEKIDICVNNAATSRNTSVFKSDEEHRFENIMQTNVMGTWYVTKAVAAHMRERHIEGSIINIGSMMGDCNVARRLTAYCISKAAIQHMTKVLVGELSPAKIRINCIMPGLFPSELTDFMHQRENVLNAFIKMIPLQEMGKQSDLDGALLYFASNNASHYVTGTSLFVDGGASWTGLLDSSAFLKQGND
jgi:NAD(P)-dependent dehydrogenase (short-subunit alcohol dehydrogenase family)